MRIFRKHSFFLCLGLFIFVLSFSGWVLVHGDSVCSAGWRSSKSWVRRSWWIWLSRKYLRYYHTHAYKYLFLWFEEASRSSTAMLVLAIYGFIIVLIAGRRTCSQSFADSRRALQWRVSHNHMFGTKIFDIFIYQHIAHWSRLSSSKTSGLSTLGINWTKFEWNLF